MHNKSTHTRLPDFNAQEEAQRFSIIYTRHEAAQNPVSSPIIGIF